MMQRFLPLCFIFFCLPLFSVAMAKAPAVQTPPGFWKGMKENTETAVFAMGCFWSGSNAFYNKKTREPLPGIISVRAGYGGGDMQNPTYDNHPGHREVVSVIYAPSIISYNQLLEIFWHNIDPFDDKGQFCDRGDSYKAAIFYQDDKQKALAEKSKKSIEMARNQPVMTDILHVKNYHEAEAAHQDYSLLHPIRYAYYRLQCGRDKRLKTLWGEWAYTFH